MSVPCPLDEIVSLQSMGRNITDIVTGHEAGCTLGLVEFVWSVKPLCALHYRAFQKQLPGPVVHLSGSITSLA